MTFPHIMALVMFFAWAISMVMVMHHLTMLDDPLEIHWVNRRCIIIYAFVGICSAIAMVLWMAM